MNDNSADYQKFTNRPALVHAVKSMPRWKWKLLGFALTVGMIGAGGQAAAFFLKAPQAAAPVQPPTHSAPAGPTAGSPPPGSSGFVGGQAPVNNPPTGSTPAAPSGAPTDTQPAPSFVNQMMTPFMSKFGFSLFVGVVVGLVFRTFLKLAFLLTTLVVGGAMALSYFHIMNVDLTLVKTDAAQATSWLTEQGYRLKDMIFHALPSSTAGTVGFLFGFKKK